MYRDLHMLAQHNSNCLQTLRCTRDVAIESCAQIERYERVMAQCIVKAKGVAQDAMLKNVNFKAAGGGAGARGRKRARGADGAGDGAESDGDEDGDQADKDGTQEDEEMEGADSDEDGAGDGEGVPATLRGAFGGLSRELQRTIDEGARERKGAELAGKIDAAEAALDKVAPNNKAPEEYEEARAEIAAIRQASFSRPSANWLPLLACVCIRASAHSPPACFSTTCRMSSAARS
jgi:hypothetical protein